MAVTRSNYTPSLKDCCQTPPCMVDLLIPYLPAGATIWEPAAGQGWIVDRLQTHGFNVIAGDIQTGQDYFAYSPESYDVQVTNPPYNQYQLYPWFRRAYQLGKPFALLAKTECVGVQQSASLFKANGVGIIQPIGRVDFKMPFSSWEDSSSTFPTCWYTWGLGLDGIEWVDFEMVKPSDKDIVYQTINGNYGQLGF